MRYEYLIDGYNLIRARGEGQRKHGPGNLERERIALVGWIAARVEEPSLVTVVFDAASSRVPEDAGSESSPNGIKVLFASDFTSADACIIELCRKHSHPKQLVVVSNDREIQQAARRRRAIVFKCEEFESTLNRKIVQPQPPPKPDVKTTGASSADAAYWREVFGTQALELPEASETDSPEPDDWEQFKRDMREFEP